MTTKEEWINFLSAYPWQVFFTQTYEDQPKYARLAIDRTWRVWRVVQIRYKLEHMFVFSVAEQHKGGAYHAHGLAMGEPNLLTLPNSLLFMWLLGREKYGICRYESLQRIGGVVGYVSKYLVKRPAVEWDFFGDVAWAKNVKLDKKSKL
mgnify:CR=1 FL=1